MTKYEELYKYAQYVFDAEVSRFGRVEDKANRFIAVVTSLLAVYALTGRQLFGELIPAENLVEQFLLLLAGLVLVGLLFSWIFAFYAIRIQGMKKAPLNDQILSFYNDNELINIYYGMAKQFSISLEYNNAIINLKAKRIERSFWCIVATVAFFIMFIAISAFNAYLVKTRALVTQVAECKTDVRIKNNTSNFKEKIKMSEDDNNGNAQPESPTESERKPLETPDLDIEAPGFHIGTESFSPVVLPDRYKLKK